MFFPIWEREFSQIASSSDNEDLKAWLDLGKAKSELGMKLLKHPLRH
jgi:hypothetical protein